MGPDWDGNEWWAQESKRCNDNVSYGRPSPEDTCPECGNPLADDGFCDPCSQAVSDFEERAYGRD